MAIWSAEIKELERLYDSFKGLLLYSRRCLEVILTDLCECELKRERGTEPLKGIIDKLNKERKVPSHIITSMHGLNDLSTYGTHPKAFDPEQVKPVLNNLNIIIKWYLKYKGFQTVGKSKSEVEKSENRVSFDKGKKTEPISGKSAEHKKKSDLRRTLTLKFNKSLSYSLIAFFLYYYFSYCWIKN